MNLIQEIVVAGVIGIVAFDVLASLASRSLGFRYVYATVGSWLIYAMVGFAIGRIAPVSNAAGGVAVVAFAESTIGWWLSWIIGPGQLESGTVNSTQILTTIITVTVIGAVIGAAAGALGRSRPPPGIAVDQAPRCTDSTITGNRVGAIRIAMTLDSVRAACRIIRDTTEMDEGESGRVVYSLVAGDTVRIDVRHDSVEFITVRGPRFMTWDSIRPGMPLARYLPSRRPEVVVGEGKVFLLDPTHCGNSFGLSGEAYGRVGRLTTASLARLPRSTLIDQIGVTGTSTRPDGRCL